MTPRILTTQIKRHESAEHKTHSLESNQNVAECDVHCHSDTAFGRAADVVAIPGDALGDVGVDSAGDEEDADIFDGVVLGGDEHDEADEAALR
jgi:hypothetical protein